MHLCSKKLLYFQSGMLSCYDIWHTRKNLPLPPCAIYVEDTNTTMNVISTNEDTGTQNASSNDMNTSMNMEAHYHSPDKETTPPNLPRVKRRRRNVELVNESWGREQHMSTRSSKTKRNRRLRLSKL